MEKTHLKLKKEQTMTKNKNIEDLLKEIKDYFNSVSDSDFMKYNDHEFSTIENIMNEDVPAPWDKAGDHKK